MKKIINIFDDFNQKENNNNYNNIFIDSSEMARVLVVGAGGRENAIAWKLSLSSKVRIEY